MDPRKPKQMNAENNDFYCRLRQYQGLKQGKYSVKARKTVYTPFCLGVRFNEIEMPVAAASTQQGQGGAGDKGSPQQVNEVRQQLDKNQTISKCSRIPENHIPFSQIFSIKTVRAWEFLYTNCSIPKPVDRLHIRASQFPKQYGSPP